MDTIGLIGGMSWHSTLDYYRAINARVAEALGGHHSARILLTSLDFDAVRDCQVREDWDAAGAMLAEEARRLETAGADRIALCTNLMHKVAPAVEAAIDVPLDHIGDAVALAARERGIARLGILGTDWVMRERFYADRLAAHGVDAVVPGPEDRAIVDRIVWDELTRGIVRDASRDAYRGVVERLVAQGAEGVVLACTEIQLLLGPGDVAVPVIDSMAAHADAIATRALQVVVA
ncbi:aspartate/glutamate racemase family protein [Agrococcus sp. SGAir0287]|uniref:aspartate/glutamate racemase family protein n=1 Tax=Agrococcus sp. SGAir0287 TaxID=2070347 RepID=UPI0010CCB2F3|nr:amino acid racemase [Agrococcus sp. SGAir0287]QCR19148.1 aspartate/glutamate racemase [Agrococcus sp. SGAir0287]